MVLIGLCVMVISIITSIKINKIVRPELRLKWSIITGLMLSFLVGYGAFLYLQFQNLEKYLELIAGVTFLGGAIFVVIVMNLIQNTLTLTNKISKSLEDAKARLESVLNSAIPLCITNKDFKIIQSNNAYRNIFGNILLRIFDHNG